MLSVRGVVELGQPDDVSCCVCDPLSQFGGNDVLGLLWTDPHGTLAYTAVGSSCLPLSRRGSVSASPSSSPRQSPVPPTVPPTGTVPVDVLWSHDVAHSALPYTTLATNISEATFPPRTPERTSPVVPNLLQHPLALFAAGGLRKTVDIFIRAGDGVPVQQPSIDQDAFLQLITRIPVGLPTNALFLHVVHDKLHAKTRTLHVEVWHAGHEGTVHRVILYIDLNARRPSGPLDDSGGPPGLSVLSCLHSGKQTFVGHTGHIRDLCLDKRSGRIASVSDDGTARLWSMETGHCTHVFEGHKDDVMAVSLDFLSRFGVVLTGSKDRSLRLWTTGKGSSVPIDAADTVSPVRCLTTLADHRLVVVGGAEGAVRIYKLVAVADSGRRDVVKGLQPLGVCSVSHGPIQSVRVMNIRNACVLLCLSQTSVFLVQVDLSKVTLTV